MTIKTVWDRLKQSNILKYLTKTVWDRLTNTYILKYMYKTKSYRNQKAYTLHFSGLPIAEVHHHSEWEMTIKTVWDRLKHTYILKYMCHFRRTATGKNQGRIYTLYFSGLPITEYHHHKPKKIVKIKIILKN